MSVISFSPESRLTFQQMHDQFVRSLDSLESIESYQAIRSRQTRSVIASVKHSFPIIYPNSVDVLKKDPDPFLKFVSDLGVRDSLHQLTERIKQEFSRY